MQTFLLSDNHTLTAQLLDYKRLGKQRLECTQLMDVLLRKAGLLNDGKTGWNNHVAIDYWYDEKNKQNYLPALILYTDVMIAEWVKRGYNNTLEINKWKTLVKIHPNLFNFGLPPWTTNSEKIIESHRARVLQKDENFYFAKFVEFDISVPENWQQMEYIWMRLTQAQAKKLTNSKK
jgi:hypothetical protein